GSSRRIRSSSRIAASARSTEPPLNSALTSSVGRNSGSRAKAVPQLVAANAPPVRAGHRRPDYLLEEALGIVDGNAVQQTLSRDSSFGLTSQKSHRWEPQTAFRLHRPALRRRPPEACPPTAGRRNRAATPGGRAR